MFRVQTALSNHRHVFQILRNGALEYTTGEAEEAITFLTCAGVQKPRELVAAVLQWGVVEVCEAEKPWPLVVEPGLNT